MLCPIIFNFKQDLVKEIKKVAAFLNTPVTEEQIALLKEHLLFDNFAKNESVNYEMPKKLGALNNDGHFIRKGKLGSLEVDCFAKLTLVH